MRSTRINLSPVKHAAAPSQRAVALVRGVGLHTALGRSADETWSALLAGRCISDHSRAAGLLAVGAEADCRVTELASSAARQAVARAGWGASQLSDSALIVGTSKGPAESWLSPPPSTNVKAGTAGRLHPAGLASIATSLKHELATGGPALTVSAACASSLHALARAELMLLAGEARRVILVGTESSLHPLFLGCYQRLGVLAPPGHGCRPFDEDRAGFLASEAAAAVCLEAIDPGTSPDAERDSDSPWQPVALERCRIAADPTHLTGGDPDAGTIRRLLALVAGSEMVDLVHAHGTGTIANDAAELAAIDAILGHASPTLYSHKAALGHSLGAAGLVAVVINCMAHQRGVVPPNTNTRRPIVPAAGAEHGKRQPSTGSVQLSQAAVRRPIRRSVTIAAGFGGACAAASLVSV